MHSWQELFELLQHSSSWCVDKQWIYWGRQGNNSYAFQWVFFEWKKESPEILEKNFALLCSPKHWLNEMKKNRSGWFVEQLNNHTGDSGEFHVYVRPMLIVLNNQDSLDQAFANNANLPLALIS